MADKTINDLTAVSSVVGGNLLPVWQGGGEPTKKATVAQVLGRAITAAETAAGIVDADISSLLYEPGDFRRYALGAADDSTLLNKIFAAAAGLVLIGEDGSDYTFASALTVPGEDIRFRANGCKFTLTTSIAGNTPAITFQSGGNHDIDLLEVEVNTAVTIDRVVQFNSPGRARRIKVTSVDQQANTSDVLDAAVDIRSDDFVVGMCYVSNFDKSFETFGCTRILIGQLYVTSYVLGIRFENTDGLTVGHIFAETASANATTSPGHNSVLFEGVTHARIGKIDSGQAGEHGVRMGSGDSANAWIDIGSIHSFEAGQCGLKISDTNNAHHITIGSLQSIDCADTSAAGSNEDGLRLEHCRDVSIGEFICGVQTNNDACYDGIFMDNVKRISIGTALMREVANHGVAMVDTTGELREVSIGRLDVITCGGDAINIDSQTQDLADIHIDNFYARNWTGYAVQIIPNSGSVGIAQPCSIIGRVYDSAPGTGVLVLGTTDKDLRVELTGAENRETATGTFTCSVYTKETRIDSVGGAVTATLPDGVYEGQQKVITMSDASNSSTLTVTSHETSSPEVFTFAQTTDYLVLQWARSQAFWWTVKNIGAAV